MRRKIFKTTLLVLLSMAIGSSAYAYREGDFQIWHTEAQEVSINKKARIGLEEEFRYGNDAEELYYHHYDIALYYDICKNFTISGSYRQIYDLKKKKFMEENEPSINGIIKWDMFGFKFEDRNRFEYRHFRYQDDNVRYRNKITMKFPWKVTMFKIQPYLSDEVFADLNNAVFNRNRFYAGVGLEFNKYLKGDIYYMFQSAKGSNKWTDANVLGLKLKLAF